VPERRDRAGRQSEQGSAARQEYPHVCGLVLDS
jgi:hypothetical protein